MPAGESYDATHVTLAEYGALRDESASARQAQQTILSWSIGGIAVITAGALATMGKQSTDLDLVRMGVTGFVLPVLIAGAALAWAGEMIRVERIGYYLRGRERMLWSERRKLHRNVDPTWVLDPREHPLLWENFIAFAAEKGVAGRKQVTSYYGGCIIYGGSLLASLFVFAWILHNHAFAHGDLAFTLAGYAWAGAVAGGQVALLSYYRHGLTRRARQAAGVEFADESQAPPAS